MHMGRYGEEFDKRMSPTQLAFSSQHIFKQCSVFGLSPQLRRKRRLSTLQGVSSAAVTATRVQWSSVIRGCFIVNLLMTNHCHNMAGLSGLAMVIQVAVVKKIVEIMSKGQTTCSQLVLAVVAQATVCLNPTLCKASGLTQYIQLTNPCSCLLSYYRRT